MRIFHIGRNYDNDIVYDSNVVSGYHAEITIDDNGRMTLTDRSRNGTYVNGMKLCRDRCEVRITDRITFPDGSELNWNVICPHQSLPQNRQMYNNVNSGMAQNVNIVIGATGQYGGSESQRHNDNHVYNGRQEYSSMSMGDAINSVFSKFATFQGRARRSEYWYWMLFYILILIIPIIGWFIWPIIAFIPTLALTVRRLHDTGKSGWLLLLVFVPIANLIISIIFFIWYCTDSDYGDNQYGANPKIK